MAATQRRVSPAIVDTNNVLCSNIVQTLESAVNCSHVSAALEILADESADGNMDSEYLANLHFIALMPSSCQNAAQAAGGGVFIKIMQVFCTVTCYKHCNKL